MGFLLDGDVHRETEDIVLGKRKKSPLLVELSNWFKSRYSVKILNIQFNKLRVYDNSPHYGHQ